MNDYASMTTEDFAAQYQALSDDALAHLASEGGLRPEADLALQAEIQKRSIGMKEIRLLRAEQKKAKLQMEAGNNPYSYQGTGLQLRGHKFLSETDKDKGIVVATRWIVFSFLPLVPLGSYRVKESGDVNGKTVIVKKVKLQWDQVSNEWMKTGSVVILLWCAWLWFKWWVARR
jgi:hypothetical protein